MKPPYYLLAVVLSFCLGGSQSPSIAQLDPATLSGKLSLNLKHGVWKLWEEKPVYQDITLDIICDGAKCQSEVWGFAPKFNKEVDHQGVIIASKVDNALHLKVKMQVQFHPWQTDKGLGEYEIELVPYKNELIGFYQGKFKGVKLQGSVKGKKDKAFATLKQHQPIIPQEHPRLIFRRFQLPQLRAKAQTNYGKAIITRTEQALSKPINYQGYVPNGGYHAAAYCFLALIQEKPELATKAWQIVEKSRKNPGRRILEQSPIVAGVALAYDLCYEYWGKEEKKAITIWLANETVKLINGGSPKQGWNSNAASNWNARARGAAGLAALAIYQEPSEFLPQNNKFITSNQDVWRMAKIAERNIIRYIETAIGEGGFGTEGDHYTNEPLILTVLPFLLANRNVTGTDLASQSSIANVLPHYISRLVESNKQVAVATYGRHRISPDGSLFAFGLPLAYGVNLPAINWFFERYFSLKGDKSFGIQDGFPHEAAYVLLAYQPDAPQKNPEQVFGKVFIDREKGFYNFRNRFHDTNDFVANIYVKQELVRGTWAFPDLGSFRIWGLGAKWAVAGGGDQPKVENENVIVLPESKNWWQQGKTIYFKSYNDGSSVVSLRSDNIVRKNSQQPIGIGWIRSFAVDYSQSAGVPALFAIADKFVGSVDAEEFRQKIWTMHVTGKVKIKNNTFTIEQNNGTSLQGTFIAPEQVKITYQTTERGGKILARGGNEYFVVMTVQKGKAPPVEVSGTGLDALVQLNQQTISFFQDRLNLAYKEEK
ncbi:MAG: hypothetical protein D6756_03935 [Cyanobacteria bacterium J083]|nr:MAG: hypothetical protein D6756_03935 [Cyanobacteria bacterium J083]